MGYRVWITIKGPSGREIETQPDDGVVDGSMREVLERLAASLPPAPLEVTGIRIEKE